MRPIDADKSDEIIIFDKQNELIQCSTIVDYCKRQREFLNKFPTLDVELVRHGCWVYDHWCEFKCSCCGHFSSTNPRGMEKYCPNCGAKMDEVSE